ncbi:MAG: hypothetical protein IJ695_06440 [Butyrivibrio sp.]|nr:hypothetical protein [Butyrivibrio sp.]
MLLEWIDEYRSYSKGDFFLGFNDWLKNDMETGCKTIKSLLTSEDYHELEKLSKNGSFEVINAFAVSKVLEKHSRLISWMRKLPLYYETEKNIFVHAGVDERAGEYWASGTSDELYLWKYPPTTGTFYKPIVVGHVGTYNEYLSNDPDFHDIYFDRGFGL